MDNRIGITILEATKERCLSAEQTFDLYILINSIKSVLLKYQYTDKHPFFLRLIETEEYFKAYEGNPYGVGIVTAQKMINDIIDSIIIELKTI